MDEETKLRIKALELAVEHIGRTTKKSCTIGLSSSCSISVAKEFYKFLVTPIEVKK